MPCAVIASTAACPWGIALAISVLLTRVASDHRLWMSEVANAPASVLMKLEMPAAFACSSGSTLAMASPVTGTKNITMNTPVMSVGQAICRNVTSVLKPHMRHSMIAPSPRMPTQTISRGSNFSTALPTSGEQTAPRGCP